MINLILHFYNIMKQSMKVDENDIFPKVYFNGVNTSIHKEFFGQK